MGINISSGFNVWSGRPLELKKIQADIASRNAIPTIQRYEGLEVYVLSDQKNYQLVGGTTDGNWIESVRVPTSGIFEWTNNRYQPYSSIHTGMFDSGSTDPTGVTRLNYGGYLYATRLYDDGVRVSTINHTHNGIYEPVLGNPASSGRLLASTSSGVRSWVNVMPSSWWSTMPEATESTIGGIQLFGAGDTTHYLRGDGTWQVGGGGGGGSMVYPGAGIAVSTGAAWGVSVTNNSANWNTAYGWGNHASAGYAPTANPTFSGTVTLPGTFSIVISGTDLLIKYGATTIFKLNSIGYVSALNEVEAFATI